MQKHRRTGGLESFMNYNKYEGMGDIHCVKKSLFLFFE